MPEQDKYPSSFRMSTLEPNVTYHRAAEAAVPPELQATALDERRADAKEHQAAQEEPLPAYTLGPQGPPALATGKVLVRFNEGDEAVARTAELRAAGYEIVREVPYAPHAALIRAASGKVSDALSNL